MYPCYRAHPGTCSASLPKPKPACCQQPSPQKTGDNRDSRYPTISESAISLGPVNSGSSICHSGYWAGEESTDPFRHSGDHSKLKALERETRSDQELCPASFQDIPCNVQVQQSALTPCYWLPPYGNPSSYMPFQDWGAQSTYSDTKVPYQIPPTYPHCASTLYPSSFISEAPPPVGRGPKGTKRLRSPVHDSKKRKCHQRQSHPCIGQSSKSVRRKKKMYSDFVGVTYNKTHSKYQACITHYRKQHYLGRYKLAVDAALAYDESAKLLKGSSWKVNFQTRQDYEQAKLRELESVGRMGGNAVDVAGSLAAVAMKVEEIASCVRRDGKSRRFFFKTGSHGANCFASNHRQVYPQEGSPRRIGMIRGGPPSEGNMTDPSLTKTIQSPTFHPIFTENEAMSLQTPIPASPNPSRHTVGNEESSPDSAIRPKVLTFRQSRELNHGSLPHHLFEHAVEGFVGVPSEANHHLSSPQFAATLPSRLEAAPTAIQNGTLAAASALMTLFGKEGL